MLCGEVNGRGGSVRDGSVNFGTFLLRDAGDDRRGDVQQSVYADEYTDQRIAGVIQEYDDEPQHQHDERKDEQQQPVVVLQAHEIDGKLQI